MKRYLLAYYTFHYLMMPETAATADQESPSKLHPNVTSILHELQNSVNLLTNSRMMTLLIDQLQSSSSVPNSEIKLHPVQNWSTFWQVFRREFFGGVMWVAICSACNIVANMVKILVNIDHAETFVGAVVTEICFRLNVYPLHICEGFVRLSSGNLVYAMKHTPYNTSTICASIIGFGCFGQDDDLWTVKLPEKPKPPVITPKQPKDGSPTLTVLHLTDPHIDLYYSDGSPADCGVPNCCRKDSPPSLSGVTAGPWGAYADCDIPLRTLINMLDHINATIKPDIVLFTGDLPAHDMWAATRKEILHLLDLTGDILKKYFPEAVFCAVGNHESAPMDRFPTAIVKGNESNAWLYEKLVSVWGKWLPDSTFPTIRRGAFYSAPARNGLRIISINVDFGASENLWLMLNYTDPMDQLQWLVDELQKAEDIGEKVLLITHIPPGFIKLLPVWTQNLYNIVNRYENTIIGTLAGHLHYDYFQIFYDESDANFKRPTRVTYLSPSITAESLLNLAYRTYTLDGDYDGSTFEILDHTTYYADLETGNRNNVSLDWKKLYSAKEFYGMESLQASEWDKLVKNMKTNRVLFDKFYSMYSQNNSAFPPCDAHCKENMLCTLKCAKAKNNTFCNV